MRDLFYLIAFVFAGKMVWDRVLKKSVYSEDIPLRLKRLHAFIIWFGTICSLYSIGTVVWMLHYYPEIVACLASQANVLGKPMVGAATIIYGLTGTSLIPVWHGMALREKKMLKWFFILWPITFFSFAYTGAMRDLEHLRHPILTNVMVLALPTCLWVATLVFYSPKVVKIIFRENEPPIETANVVQA